ncbi:DUF6345 domain-containing protein [Microbacterium allomyrinae]|uniref:Uncharacterized protein n=1 Tax=Microbacterium allomyrinae TaxID=2830666 RepID=A0A9X1LX75_9MICO|nr:DUF6345 domain-containing protein [Microbacterium allomyrinae]MCC2033745.1 hypothetical protein [Microbacterium allomyrinae]
MSVIIDPESIRPHEDTLYVLRLGDRTEAGAERVGEIARATAPEAEPRRLGETATGFYVDDRLVAFADATGGESRNFPQLDVLAPSDGLADRAFEAAAELARDEALIPRDATNQTVLAPTSLRGSRASRRRVGDSADYLGFARIQRTVRDIPVVGRGSRATVSVSDDGVEALAHNWRYADVVEEHSGAGIDRGRVIEAISEALAPIAEEQDVHVESARLVYYDADADLIQPAFRFIASYGRGDRVDDEDQIGGHLVGYVPALELFEELPPTLTRPRVHPKEPLATAFPRLNTRPTLGRYVVREDNAGWVASANSFLSGLRTAQTLFGTIAPIDRQYYWAEPRLYTDENREFIDAVQVALTESHGNWHIFSTLKDNADIVRFGDIPGDGYGGAARAGALAYWILHSCSVIPTSLDSDTSYDPWWDVFQGLHAAVGYRTKMWINDEVSFRYAFFAALGAPMVSNWLTTVINDDSYWPVETYVDNSHYDPERTVPWGRPSAVNVLGHAGDTIFQTTPLGRPSVLQQWWYGD